MWIPKIYNGKDRTFWFFSLDQYYIRGGQLAGFNTNATQVVSGGAAHPDGAPSGGRRGWAFYQSQALAPDLLSNRAGFAELIVGADAYAAQLHQRKHGRWRSAQLLVPRERPPHPAETVSPVMDPCLRCDPLTPRQ